MDDDLDILTREDLVMEARRLRAGIRRHRDSTGHALCWHHPELWSLLPEKPEPAIAVPDWPQFMRGCVMYRQSLDAQAPDAPRLAREFGPESAATKPEDEAAETDLSEIYRGYIACLNTQDWRQLGTFVHDDVAYNGVQVGLSGYRKMLERDFAGIPDLRFDIALLVSEGSHVASRLLFDCSPQGTFLGLPVNGKRVTFSENVFYGFREGKIAAVWSVIDKAAIENQL